MINWTGYALISIKIPPDTVDKIQLSETQVESQVVKNHFPANLSKRDPTDMSGMSISDNLKDRGEPE